MRRPILLLLMSVLALVACSVPSMSHVKNDEIGDLKELSELMWVHGDVADPRFAEADDHEANPDGLPAASLAMFEEAGARLKIASANLPEFRTDKGFVGFARTLNDQAATLEQAAHDGDRARVVSITMAIRETCRDCHDRYR